MTRFWACACGRYQVDPATVMHLGVCRACGSSIHYRPADEPVPEGCRPFIGPPVTFIGDGAPWRVGTRAWRKKNNTPVRASLDAKLGFERHEQRVLAALMARAYPVDAIVDHLTRELGPFYRAMKRPARPGVKIPQSATTDSTDTPDPVVVGSFRIHVRTAEAVLALLEDQDRMNDIQSLILDSRLYRPQNRRPGRATSIFSGLLLRLLPLLHAIIRPLTRILRRAF